MKNKLIVVIGVLVAAAAAFYAYNIWLAPNPSQDPEVIASGGTGLAYEDERILGDKNAPITLVEYASFTCPHCANFHNGILAKLKEEYIDKGAVRVFYRHFPLDNVAFSGALVANCLPEDQFFPFVDLMYKTQATWAPQRERGIAQLATTFGVDNDKFAECQGNKQAQISIMERRQEAHDKLEVNSTPFVLVNGQRMGSGRNYEDFTDFIDRELAKVGFVMPIAETSDTPAEEGDVTGEGLVVNN